MRAGVRVAAAAGGFRAARALIEVLEEAAPTLCRHRQRGSRGLRVGSRRPRAELLPRDVCLTATVEAAVVRCSGAGGAVVAPGDLRAAVRERRRPWAVAFVVDASSSMRRGGRMSRAKGLLAEWLEEARRRRDRVALVGFGHDRSTVLAPFGSSAGRVAREVSALEIGGRTPLASGLDVARRACLAERTRAPDSQPALVVLSDGRANATALGGDPDAEAVASARRIGRDGIVLVFVDTEDDPMAMGCGLLVARAAGGAYAALEDLWRRGGAPRRGLTARRA